MSVNYSGPQSLLIYLILTDDEENEAIEFESARLNLLNRAVELKSLSITPADAHS